MGRARIISVLMHCHNCTRQWYGTMCLTDDHMRALHNLTNPHEPCSRCSITHGDGTKCKFLPDTCTCEMPHVEIIRNQGNRTGLAQVRAEQRAVVYLMPDGSTSAPSSNKFDDPIALAAVAQGGIRHEFPSVRSMMQFNRERASMKGGDEFADRCLTIDYNEGTIRNQDTYLNDWLKREDAERGKVYDRERPDAKIQVYFDNGERYKEACRRNGRDPKEH